MTWSRFDDGYDEHEKVQEAWDEDPATVGLHVMATTACNRWLSDGVIRPRWLRAMLPDEDRRERVLDIMVRRGLFDVLPAGATRTLEVGGQQVQLGPHAELRYVVHDFLDRHDCREQVKARRQADAERKSKRRQPAAQQDGPRDSGGSPAGIPAESTAPRARGRTRAPASRPDPTRPSKSPPTPPQAGGAACPAPPAGNRQRQAQRYERQVAAWMAEHELGQAVQSKVVALAAHMRFLGLEPTVQAMYRYVAEHPAWGLGAEVPA